MRLRADGQRQGQITDRRPHPRAVGPLKAQAATIRVTLIGESDGAPRRDDLETLRSGNGQGRWCRPCAGKLGHIRRLLA